MAEVPSFAECASVGIKPILNPFATFQIVDSAARVLGIGKPLLSGALPAANGALRTHVLLYFSKDSFISLVKMN